MDKNGIRPRRKKVISKFGERLKFSMTQRNLSHRQVASMIGVSISVVNGWVGRGGCIPHDLSRVHLLAQKLNVSFEWLLGLDGKTSTTQQNPMLFEEQFEEVPVPELTGIFRIEVKRLQIKKKKI